MKLYSEDLNKKISLQTEKSWKIFLYNVISKKIKDVIMGSGITLRNNEVKGIVKAIRSLENKKFIERNYQQFASQEWWFLNFLRPLMSIVLPLMENILTPLVKSVLVQLGLTAAPSATDAAILKKSFGSSMTALIISNKEMEDTMKIVKSLEKSGWLVKADSESNWKWSEKTERWIFWIVFGYISCKYVRKYVSRKI